MKQAKFTYTGKETRYITKLFKTFDIRIAFTTKHNIRHMLKDDHSNRQRNQYNKSGVYQPKYSECNKKYVGQTARLFRIRYKEHAREYRHDTNKSNYAKHLIDNRNTLRPMEECMTILHTTVKAPMLKTPETFYIYKQTRHNNQLKDKNTVTLNAIFDAVLRNNCDSTLRI
jgi:hypothetical protein